MTEWVAYTDGSAEPVGKKFRAGFGIYWQSGLTRHQSYQIFDTPTINRAELWGVIFAIEIALANFKKLSKYASDKPTSLIIHTDSTYVLRSCYRDRAYIEGRTVNKDLVVKVNELLNNSPIKIELKKVAGHSGDYGNDCADWLAKQSISK